ncbi:hypothetical protein RJ55_03504 [Drechmeria coniospora]|nr:hypothetical protein RJ55_03504 [Drechmeria coniospora]
MPTIPTAVQGQDGGDMRRRQAPPFAAAFAHRDPNANPSSKRIQNRHERADENPCQGRNETAAIGRRDDDGGVCGPSMKSCPGSLGGNCCPDGYDCGRDSCFAQTRGPSSCGTKLGWFPCAAVYGGGCCPDGYLCRRAADCAPPSGVAYTYGCPTGQYLCPASASYGCCPTGMGCAVNQCYSTEPTTVTTTVLVTATGAGVASVYTSTETSVSSPRPPTALPTVDAGDEADAQKVLKYFPLTVPKTAPTAQAGQAGQARQVDQGRLSAAAVAGIVAGSVSFVVVVALVVVLLLCRRRKQGKPKAQARERDPERERENKVVMTMTDKNEEMVTEPLTENGRNGRPDVDMMLPTQAADSESDIISRLPSPNEPPTTEAGTDRRPKGMSGALRWMTGSSRRRRQHGNVSSGSGSGSGSEAAAIEGARGATTPTPTAAELEGGRHVAELPGSPASTLHSPQEETRTPHWRRHRDHGILGTRLDAVDEEQRRPSTQTPHWRSHRDHGIPGTRLDAVDEEQRRPSTQRRQGGE